MEVKKLRRSVFLDVQKIMRESLRVPPLSDNLVEDVGNANSGNMPVVVVPEDERGSLFLEEGDQLVVEPDSFSGSRDLEMVGCELRIVDPVVDAGSGLPVSELDTNGELGVVLAGTAVGSACIPAEVSNLLAEVDCGGASREQSAIGEDEDSEDDEGSKRFGDSSCPSEEPFYFAPPPAESLSKRRREVSRHDVAFMRGKPRLMALWEGEQHLVFGIGGHLRTVVDWYKARKRDEALVAQWEPVVDPARPDVPLYIEFTAVFGEEKVAVGTVIKAEDKALVPWLFMCNSSRVGAGVNTQFFWCSTDLPVGFWTSVPIVCRVIVYQLPSGSELFLMLALFVRSMPGRLRRAGLRVTALRVWTPAKIRLLRSI